MKRRIAYETIKFCHIIAMEDSPHHPIPNAVASVFMESYSMKLPNNCKHVVLVNGKKVTAVDATDALQAKITAYIGHEPESVRDY
jgi:hypothetical protein